MTALVTPGGLALWLCLLALIVILAVILIGGRYR